MIPFPDKKYKIIYADPPWEYFLYEKQDWRGTANKHYNTMSLEEIKKLPIQSISDDDCVLFLWGTFPNIQEALDVIVAWGFVYKTIGFIWVKTNKNNAKPFFGMGCYTKSNSEFCLIATRGSLEIQNNDVSSVVISPIKKHSEKPNEIRKRIERLCGNLSRIELFARTKVNGWDTWGNDPNLTESQPLESFNY